MTDDEKREAVALELRHASAALAAARLLCGAALHNDALSRLYYALFHTMTALLLTEGVEPRRHRSMPGLLGTKFAASGLLTASDIAVVSRAATYRDLADYERTWQATSEVTDAAFAEIEPIMVRVRASLNRIGGCRRPQAGDDRQTHASGRDGYVSARAIRQRRRAASPPRGIARGHRCRRGTPRSCARGAA